MINAWNQGCDVEEPNLTGKHSQLTSDQVAPSFVKRAGREAQHINEVMMVKVVPTRGVEPPPHCWD